uniref:Bifunctional inhibitor/plant lipid transfer protein/seed storage helical domain-containing protein n=1 Tax=Oryza meridionalis TaxID=40149 RepID=A0A0E0D4S1_9ORYZ
MITYEHNFFAAALMAACCSATIPATSSACYYYQSLLHASASQTIAGQCGSLDSCGRQGDRGQYVNHAKPG